MTSITRFATLCCALTFSVSATAAEGSLGQTRYVVLTGDINADGQNDVLMKAVPGMVFIPLDDDLTVPITVPPRNPTFALISTSYGNYSLIVNPDAATVGRSAWQAGTQAISFYGAEGDMSGSVSIRGTNAEQASFVVSMLAVDGTLRLSSVSAPATNNPPPGEVTPLCD